MNDDPTIQLELRLSEIALLERALIAVFQDSAMEQEFRERIRKLGNRMTLLKARAESERREG